MANFLTDLFTGAPAKDAAAQQRALFDVTKNQNVQDIGGGQGMSLANLGTGFDAGRAALGMGYNTGVAGVNAGYGDAQGFLGAGAGNARAAYGQARGDLGNAAAAFDPLAGLGQKYGGATSLALNSLGVNGQPAQQTARDAFTAGPGYNFNMEQGLEAINRRRNMGGMLNSGNADRDAQTFGAGLASNEYDKWMANLQSYTNPELSATSGAATGRAQANTNLANLGVSQAGFENTLGQNQAGLATGRGAMLADLARSYGTGMAGNYTGEGMALAGVNTNAANARVGNANTLVQPYAKTYGDEAQAELTGSKNAWGLGMAGAQLAMGMPPTSLASLGGGNPSMGGNSNPFMSSGVINPAYLQYG